MGSWFNPRGWTVYRRQLLETGPQGNSGVSGTSIPPNKLVPIRQAFRHFAMPG